MTAGEVAGFLGGYAASLPAPVVEHAEVLFGAPRRRRLPRSSPAPAPGPPTLSCSRPAGATCRESPMLPRPSTRVCTSSPRTATAIPPTCRTAACWSSAPQPPGCSSPTNSPRTGRPGRHRRWSTLAAAQALPRQRHHVLARHARGQPPQSGRSADRPRCCGNHRCSWPDRPDDRDVHLARCRLGASVVGRLSGAAGDRVSFAADLPATTTAADVRSAPTAHPDRPARRRTPPDPRTARAASRHRWSGHRPEPAHGRASAPSCGPPPATAAPTHGPTRAGCSTPPGRSATTAAAPPPPDCSIVGANWQSHAGPSPSTVSATTPPR